MIEKFSGIITIAGTEFDDVTYDREVDVLYLHVGNDFLDFFLSVIENVGS